MRRRRLRKVRGQLPLPFGRIITVSTPRTTSKVRFQDFDPKKHVISDLDLRTIPRAGYTKLMAGCIAGLTG